MVAFVVMVLLLGISAGIGAFAGLAAMLLGGPFASVAVVVCAVVFSALIALVTFPVLALMSERVE